MRFVCIKNNVVDNIVEADQTFADQVLANMYDVVQNFADPSLEPRIGYIYDLSTQTFIDPMIAINEQLEAQNSLNQAIQQVKLNMLNKSWDTLTEVERKIQLGLEVSMQELVAAGLIS